MLKIQSFRGDIIRNVKIANYNGKTYIPKPLRKNVIDWYHTQLIKPGANRKQETINHHLYCPGIQIELNPTLKKCETCQFYKKSNRKFGHMPEK